MTTHTIIDQLPHARIAFFMRYLAIVGFMTLLAFAFLFLMFLVYVAQLCILSLTELAHMITSFYSSSDNLIRLLFIALVTWIVFKLVKKVK